MPQFFTASEYRPLAVEGSLAERVCAFLRMRNGRMVIIVAGRHFAALTAPAATLPAPEAWRDTTLTLPEGQSSPLRDLFTGQCFAGGGTAIPIRDLFGHLPIAVLTSSVES
jgi:(1->4)-alpha-D-glucan 1-alpha-D-glucosylmutase